MVDLEHLRIFAQAAELKNFTKTAESLGVGQPTVSRIIGELEGEWGGALFQRTGHGVELSDRGREALKGVQTLLRDFDRMSDKMGNRAGLTSRTVTLALPPSLITSFLPTLFNRLKTEKPEIRLRIHEGSTAQIEQWLSEGVAEIGLYSEYRINTKGKEGGGAKTRRTEVLRMSKAPMMLAAPAGGDDLPDEIDFEQLSGFPLVLPSPSRGMRVVIDAAARATATRLNVVAEADSMFAREALTLKCGCYMLRTAIPPDMDDGSFKVCVVRNPSIQRHIVLSTAQKRSLSRTAREVASIATAMLRAR